MMSRSMASLDGCVSAGSALMWEDAMHTGISRMPAELHHQKVMHLQPVGG